MLKSPILYSFSQRYQPQAPLAEKVFAKPRQLERKFFAIILSILVYLFSGLHLSISGSTSEL
jgi:lysozyme family protein